MFFLVLVFFLLLNLTLTAQEPIVISIWFHSVGTQEGVATLNRLQEYQTAHPDIELQIIRIAAESYSEQVRLAAYGAAVVGDLQQAIIPRKRKARSSPTSNALMPHIRQIAPCF